MADIKASEVTAILKKQLAGLDLDENMQEVGTVLNAGDGIARVFGSKGEAVVEMNQRAFDLGYAASEI